jgi:electron transfer flavoprotein alpha subunit
MAVGFGPIVFPEDEETEVDETVVVEEVLKSSKLFVEETLRVEDIIAEQALELDSSVTSQIEQIEILREQRKTRKCLIIGGMAFACVFLFFLSLMISSRVSCFTKSKKSKSGSDILADQIQKELNRPSKI